MSIKLFVQGFPPEMTETELLELFSHHALVTDLYIVREGIKSLCYGFVQLPNQSAAERAIAALNGKTIENQRISVRLAQEKRPASPKFSTR
jgi:RNA recognition motif-containing protein